MMADVFVEEGSARGAGGQDAVVAVEASPFGEVVGDVEGGGGGNGVFVVDEGYIFDGRVAGGGGAGLDDYVAAQEVGVGEYKLQMMSVTVLPHRVEGSLGIRNGSRAQMCYLIRLPCVPTLSAVGPSASSRPRLSWGEQIPISA